MPLSAFGSRAASRAPLNMKKHADGRLILRSHFQTTRCLRLSLAYVYGRETKANADIAKVLTMDEAAHCQQHCQAASPAPAGPGVT